MNIKTDKKRLLYIGVGLLICILAELALDIYPNISLFLSGAQEKTLDLSTAVIESNSEYSVFDGEQINVDGCIITFEDVNSEMNNIVIDISGGGKNIPIGFSFTDDNFAGEHGHEYNSFLRSFSNDGDNIKLFNIKALGKVQTLRISLEDCVYAKIRSIKLNSYIGLKPNFIRFTLFLLISLIITTGFWKIVYDRKKHGRCVYYCSAVIVLVILMMFLYNILVIGSPALQDYVPGEMDCFDQYAQLFDAFYNGRVDLEGGYDIEALNSIGDPYNAGLRLDKLGSAGAALFDHSYYNGKVYCYFGAVPVLLVYFPVFMLTGKLPEEYTAGVILAVVLVILLSLLYKLLVERFTKSPPLFLVLLGQVAVTSGSLILLLINQSRVYSAAVLCGLLFLCVFFYTLLRAYYSDSTGNRLVFLIISGISVPMIVASRPTLLLYCFAAVVPALIVFSNRSDRIKNKVLYFVAMAVPIVVGAVLIMVYNFVRFDSPLDFGFEYQLTVLNSQVAQVSLSFIPATIYYYFLQPPAFSDSFPYLLAVTQKHDILFTRYSYVNINVGVFWMPVTCGVFVINTVLDTKDKMKSMFLPSLAVLAFIVAFIDMCKAGACTRYIADISMILSVVGIISIFNLIDMLKKMSKRLYFGAYAVSVLLMAVTIYFGVFIFV